MERESKEKKVRHASLFSGIGGFEIAAQWMGWENVFQVEIDKFCQKVLTKNFPNTDKHLDIFNFDGTEYRGTVDIISGGFPCQPFSIAGKRNGSGDDRHLWPQMLRVIRNVQPTFVVAENVSGLLTIEDGMVFEQVCLDLENEGYEVWTYRIPACAVNAPHRRDRVWIVAKNTNCLFDGGNETKRKKWQHGDVSTASEIRDGIASHTYDHARGSKGSREWELGNGELAGLGEKPPITHTDSERWGSGSGDRQERPNQGDRRIATQDKREWDGRKCRPCKVSATNGLVYTYGKRCKKQYISNKSNGTKLISKSNNENIPNWDRFPTQSPICRRDDGIPTQLDKHRAKRIKALGNAIVPQVAYKIFQSLGI
jgi:DNA (cytosine-5)-methyltransferase 1